MPALGLKLRLNRITAKILSVFTTGLVMWHKFTALTWNGTADRLPDSSGTGNTGKLFTGVGLSFDGVNDVVTIGSTGQTVRTVVFYAYPDTTTQKFLQLTASGGVDVGITSGTLSGAGWTSPTYYVNGVSGTTVAATTWQQIAVTSATGITASDVRLGLDNTTYYSGDLCNVKLFSIQLTASQVAELYANPEQALPTGASSSDLVGWWPIGDGIVGAGIVDGSGSGNGGLISGATVVDSLPQQVTQPAIISQNRIMAFDRANDHIDIPNVTSANGLSFFVKLVHGTDQDPLFGFSSGGAYVRLGNSILYHYTGVNLLFYGIAQTKNRGDNYALAWRAKSGDSKLYINGSLQSALTNTLSTFANSFDFIGRYSGDYTDHLILEAAIFTTELTDTELADLSSGAITPASLTTKIFGWWRNRGNTNADWVDLSGKGNNGTVQGGPGTINFLQGKTQGKDLFDIDLNLPNTGQLILGADGYAQIADAANLDITTNITVSAWVKPFATGVTQTILAKNAAYQLEVTSGNKPSFSFWSSSAEKASPTTTTTLAVNVWKYITAVYNGSNVRLYIDGVLNTTVTQTGTIDTNTNNVLIGALTTSTERFNGVIDSAKIYNSALTADQVLQNYKAEKSKYQ